MRTHPLQIALWPLVLIASVNCASGRKYQDKNMDFAAVRTVAVLPFQNLSQQSTAAERVRDVFSNMLLATGAVYVLPAGEVQRGLNRSGVAVQTAVSKEEVITLGKALSAEAVITGTVQEYGEARSGNTSANVIAVSVQMIETQTGRLVWAASTRKGGVGFMDRMFGGGGEPMNKVTEEAVNDLLNKLFH